MRRLRLRMVNACACYHSYHIVLSSCLSSKNKDQNFVLILCGYKPWSLRLRKKCLRVFENRMLKKMFVAKREDS
jgi:hypothetical protein